MRQYHKKLALTTPCHSQVCRKNYEDEVGAKIILQEKLYNFINQICVYSLVSCIQYFVISPRIYVTHGYCKKGYHSTSFDIHGENNQAKRPKNPWLGVSQKETSKEMSSENVFYN